MGVRGGMSIETGRVEIYLETDREKGIDLKKETDPEKGTDLVLEIDLKKGTGLEKESDQEKRNLKRDIPVGPDRGQEMSENEGDDLAASTFAPFIRTKRRKVI